MQKHGMSPQEVKDALYPVDTRIATTGETLRIYRNLREAEQDEMARSIGGGDLNQPPPMKILPSEPPRRRLFRRARRADLSYLFEPK